MVGIEKYQGTGNEFLVVDAAESVPDRRAFARALCDRESGLGDPAGGRTGADGVLFLDLQAELSPPRVVMTLVQPDGSVAAMCGNGARCAAAWAADRTDADVVMIDTQAGTRRATVDDGVVTIEMGEPSFAPDDVPLDADEPMIEESLAGLTVTAVDTGVPHAVAMVEDVDAIDLADVGPTVRYDERFPEGTNVTLAAPRSDDGFDQRTYERGVEGETRACGTGAVAVAAVAHRLGRIEDDATVAVHPPGGELEVTLSAVGATLRGPAEREFAGQVDPSLAGRADATGD